MDFIKNDQLNPYIIESRSIKSNSNGLGISPATGLMKLSFSQINCNNPVLLFKRMNGSDGKLIINGKSYTVPPNVTFEIGVSSSSVIISRENSKLGLISLVGVKVSLENEPTLIVMDGSWSSLLKKAKSIKGVSVTDYGVLANEGAEITGTEFISRIETDPPGCFSKTENSIKFNYNCRIILIEKHEDYKFENFNKYSALEMFNNINKNEVKNDFVVKNEEAVILEPQSVLEVQPQRNAGEKQVIFNIQKMSQVKLASKSNVKYYGNSIFLNWSGSFSFLLPNFEHSTDYTFILDCQKLNGNGKINCSIITTNNEVRSTLVTSCNSNGGKVSITLNTGKHLQPYENYFLKITRIPNVSSGDIMINSMKVMGPVPQIMISKTNNGLVHNTQYINMDLGPEVNYSYSINVSPKILYDVFEQSKFKFGNINFDESNIIITNEKLITGGRKVWIKEFDIIDQEELNKLTSVEVVMSPSIQNVKFLKSNGSNCIYMPLYYPFFDGERKENNTSLFYTDLDLPDYDDRFIHLKYYSETDKIKKLYESNNYISLKSNSHHFDPIIDIALTMGLNVFANNYSFIGRDGFNFISSLEEVELNKQIRENIYNSSYDKKFYSCLYLMNCY